MIKLKRFLSAYEGTQVFNTRNVVGDTMTLVYEDAGIKVYYCNGYDYLEIFGLNDCEYKDLIKTDNLGITYVIRGFDESEVNK